MSKADEMFDEMGYEKIHNNRRRIVYKKGYLSQIEFIMKYKWIDVGNMRISIEELQAINEKVKELGWLNENS